MQKTTTAKENTDNAQIRERIQIAYHSALAGGKGSYTKDSLMEELKKEFETDYDVDDSNDENWKMLARGQEVTIPAGKEGTPSEAYLGLRVGDTVYYKDANNNDVECVVLYDSQNENYSSFGVQIITRNPVLNAEIGNGTDFNEARDSYNDANNILNVAVKNYVSANPNLSHIAKNSRCVGSSPDNLNTVNSSRYSHEEGVDEYFTPYDEQFEIDDMGITWSDYTLLQRLQIANTTDTTYGNGSYWLFGSRCSLYNRAWPFTAFYVELVVPSGYTLGQVMPLIHSNAPSGKNLICWVDEDGTTYSASVTSGIRPVITLKSNVKIIELDGKKYIEI